MSDHTNSCIAPPFRIRLLGGLAVERDGVPVLSHFPRRKGARLLAYVALHVDRGRPRSSIAAILWPDQDLNQQRDSLRNELAALRSLLRRTDSVLDSLLSVEKDLVRINRAVATTDLAEWNARLRRCAGSRSGAETPDLKRLVAQGESAGALLPGWYDDCLTGPRLEFETLLQRALWDLTRVCAGEGNDAEARDYAQRAIALDASSAVTESARAFLTKVGGGSPPERLNAAARSKRSEGETVVVRPRLAATSFVGRRREIDEIEERVRAVVAASPDGAVCSARTASLHRLITITGTAGVGKTRLAHEINDRLSNSPVDFRRLFVPLVTVLSANDIPRAIAGALGVTPEADNSLTAQLGRVLRVQPTLLILDNLEHLLPEGRATVEALVQALLEAAPQLVVMTTSRQRLDAPFEQEIPLPPLPLPDIAANAAEGVPAATAESVLRSEGIQLFEDRMRRARPDFRVHARNAATVAALCRRLDGLPLALELVAARSGSATPAEMLQELNTRFEPVVGFGQSAGSGDTRHLTLWEAVDWSYRLLPASLRGFFAQLSVFRGGFTLESATAVCSDGDRGDAAFALESLQARSFVVAEEDPVTNGTRFRLLETLREFGAQQLSPEEQAALARRHADYFLAFIQEAARHDNGSDTALWLDRQQTEYANISTALEAFEKADDWLSILRFLAAVYYFWRARGHAWYWSGRAARLIDEVEKRYSQIAPDNPQYREWLCCLASAANAVARLNSQASNLKYSRCLSEKAILWAAESGDLTELVRAKHHLGYLEMTNGNYKAASSIFSEILGLGCYDATHVLALHSLGSVSVVTGELAKAVGYYRDSLDLSRRLQHQHLQAITLNALGNTYRFQSQFDRATECIHAALAIFDQIGDPQGCELVKRVLADTYSQMGDFGRARQYLSEALAGVERSGDMVECALIVRISGSMALKEGNLADAHRYLLRSLEMLTGIGADAQCCRAVDFFGHVAAALGYSMQAAHYWGAAAAWNLARGISDTPLEEALAAPYRAQVRAALGDAAFEQVLAVGAGMSLEDAVAAALKLPAVPAGGVG